MRNSILAVVAMTIGFSSAAQAALKDEAEIRNGLLVVGMAYEISEKCGSINARTIRGITTLYNLKSRARELGYSSAEIDTYIDNKPEKKRLESIARDQLVQLGVTPGDEASYCSVGRDQIEKGSGIGRLLY